MMRFSQLGPILGLCALVGIGGSPAIGAVDGYRSCAIKAYFVYSVVGSNVRSAPSRQSRIMDTIPNEPAAVAEVRGFQSGWFRVALIWAPELTYDNDVWFGSKKFNPTGPGVLFQGDGWVHFSQLHVEVTGGESPPYLYDRPSPRGKKIKEIPSVDRDVHLLACSGEWAKYRVDGTTGWLSPENQCSNPLTTCS